MSENDSEMAALAEDNEGDEDSDTIEIDEDANNNPEEEEEEDNEGESDDGLVTVKRKQKEKSPVWECGGEKVEGGGKCTMCGRIFKSENHNTSNLTQHIFRKHGKTAEGKKLKKMMDDKKLRLAEKKKSMKAKKEEKNKFKQSSIVSYVQKKNTIDPIKKKKIDNAIVKLIVIENDAFELVEKHNFRELLFTMDPGYICSSRRTFTNKIKEFTQKTKVDLKNDIAKDLEEVSDKVVHITSDHGTSGDRFHSRKNALTLSRCTKDYVIKTDTVEVIRCEGSQTGKVIRKNVKEELDKVGRQDNWFICWTTDGEKKQINARAPGNHSEVGMKTFYTASCVDHTAHLASEETLQDADCIDIKFSVDKAHKFVEKIKESHLMKDAFNKVMIQAGEDPLAVMLGTNNRWYFKLAEMERVLLLKNHIITFQDTYEDLPDGTLFMEEDWRNIAIYVSSLKTLADASKLLEGESFPTASSVIPFLDQVFASLTDLAVKLPESEKVFPQRLLENLQSQRRFPQGYKNVAPFNALTLLDPQYMDIYFTEEETTKAVEDIAADAIFKDLERENFTATVVTPPVVQAPPTNAFEQRRAQLLASKRVAPLQEALGGNTATFKEKLKDEITRFLTLRGTVPLKSNPQSWWREHASEYVLLSRFYRAYCAFQATSTASERVFNVEGLVFSASRKKLDKDFGSDLITTRDFHKKRQNEDLYRLCDLCPKPPSPEARYVINCELHNQKNK